METDFNDAREQCHSVGVFLWYSVGWSVPTVDQWGYHSRRCFVSQCLFWTSVVEHDI